MPIFKVVEPRPFSWAEHFGTAPELTTGGEAADLCKCNRPAARRLLRKTPSK